MNAITDSDQYEILLSNTEHYDVIVIGTGPGGEGAAMMCAKDGKSVLAIEKFSEVGGSCTHWGTIPSKALRHMVHRITMYENDPMFHAAVDRSKITRI